MKKHVLTFLGVLFFSTTTFAYELNGTSHDNGNGTYSITVHTDEGHIFTGNGVDQGDGTLLVIVKDKNGVTYRGLASNNDDSEYVLTLNDVATGEAASGILEEE